MLIEFAAQLGQAAGTPCKQRRSLPVGGLLAELDSHVVEYATGQAVLYDLQGTVLLAQVQAQLIVALAIDLIDAQDDQVTNIAKGLPQRVHFHLLDLLAHRHILLEAGISYMETLMPGVMVPATVIDLT